MSLTSTFPTVPSHTPVWMPSAPSHAPDPRSIDELRREVQRLNKLDHDMLYQLYQIMIRRMTSPEDRKAVDAHNQLLIDIRTDLINVQSELARRTGQRGGRRKSVRYTTRSRARARARKTQRSYTRYK